MAFGRSSPEQSTKDKLSAIPKSKAAKEKIKKVMGEFKAGSLHSGSSKGPLVSDRRQAVAIALSQSRKG